MICIRWFRVRVLISVVLRSIAVGIALISVLSAVGICERCRVESGGVYFLLAHVLGPRSAAAVGIVYVFGQVSVIRFT